MSAVSQEQYVFATQVIGAPPGSAVDDVTGVDFVDTDTSEYSASHRLNGAIDIPDAGNNYSYEKYVRFGCSLTVSGETYSNIKIWGPDAQPATGVTNYWRSTAVYSTPVIPEDTTGFTRQDTNHYDEGSALAIGSTLTAPGDYSEYAVMITEVGTTASPGVLTPWNMWYSYDGYGQLTLLRLDADTTDEISGVSGTFASGLGLRTASPSTEKGVLVAQTDDLQASRGNAITSASHMGQAISYAVSGQYLSIADNVILDPELDDVHYSLLLYISTLPTTGNYSYLFSKYNTNNGIQASIYNNSGTYQLILDLADGTLSSFTLTFSTQPVVGRWYKFDIVLDRSANARLFINGLFNSAVAISSRSGNVNSSGSFNVGADNTPDNYFIGYFDAVKVNRFGVNGLIVSGTGGSNLTIRVGSATGPIIYSELSADGGSVAVPVGLIPLMYKSPSSNLTQLGYTSIDNAVRTNRHDGAGNVTELTVGKWYFFDQGTVGHDLSGCATLSADGVFEASATTGSIASGDANDTVREIGEVADWSLNSVLTDGSGNGLTLTNNGSAPFVTNNLV